MRERVPFRGKQRECFVFWAIFDEAGMGVISAFFLSIEGILEWYVFWYLLCIE